MHPQSERAPSPVGQFCLVWFAVAMQLALTSWLIFRPWADPDDAMRLVEVRSFLSGKGWYDLHEPRIAPPLGYDTHWSRLVDAGLAGLYWMFEPLVGSERAELLMAFVWPLLCLGVSLAAMMATARRLAGDSGLLASGFIGILGFQAYFRFLPGRIDHHSVQIMLSLAVLYLVLAAQVKPRAGLAAGAVTAVALAVGLESIVFLAVAAGTLALLFVRDERQGKALAFFGCGLAIGLVAVYLGTIAPSRWMNTACDALGFNLTAPLVVAGIGVALLAAVISPRSPGLRAAMIIGLAVATAAAVVLLQPRCLGGPFEMVDQTAKREWLDGVGESMPLFTLDNMTRNLEMTAPLLVMCIASAVLLAVKPVRENLAFQTVLAVFIAAMVIALTNAKIAAYALWFGMPIMALAAALLWSRLGLSRLWLKALLAALLAPFPYAAAQATLKIVPVLSNSHRNAPTLSRHVCTGEDYRTLAELPPGLVLTNVDDGPFVLLMTPHSVLAAPYHRLSKQIVQTMHIFNLPPDEAEAAVAATGARYVVICNSLKGVTQGTETGNPDSLNSALLAGQAPRWLTPIAGVGDGIRAYEIRLSPSTAGAVPTSPAVQPGIVGQ